RRFEDLLVEALRQSERNHTRTALLMLDLNGFKQINDSYGHDAGDELLQRVAHNLRAAIRAPDTIARLGGDEFIVIVTDLPVEESVDDIVENCVARLSRALRKPVQIK